MADAVADRPLLLAVMELGGYPDFLPLYQSLGYRVVRANSIRKALQQLKKERPAAVVAEFNYAPTYGTRISTVEPLLATLQSRCPDATVVLFCEAQRQSSFAPLRGRYPEARLLPYPIQQESLAGALRIGKRDAG
jgi:hypothetical protein